MQAVDSNRVNKIRNKWELFKKSRNNGDYRHEIGKHWLTMLKRESMLDETLNILKKIQNDEEDFD